MRPPSCAPLTSGWPPLRRLSSKTGFVNFTRSELFWYPALGCGSCNNNSLDNGTGAESALARAAGIDDDVNEQAIELFEARIVRCLFHGVH